nr:MAG TPA: distal tail protein [Caudoviricetes sp.]
MMGKVFFDGKDTYTEYGLLLASKSISLPEVRTNMIDVPGRDGLLDASEVLTGEVTYKNRTIRLKLTGVDTVSGKKWPATISDFCNKVHGKRVKVTFPEDTAHYYSGRCSVGEVGLVKMMQTIPVTVNCDPWKYKNAKTTVSRSDLGTVYKQLSLPNESRPVIPTVTVAQDTTLLWGSSTINISAGDHILPAIRLAAGSNTLKAKVASGTGSITVTYQEASL